MLTSAKGEERTTMGTTMGTTMRTTTTTIVDQQQLKRRLQAQHRLARLHKAKRQDAGAEGHSQETQEQQPPPKAAAKETSRTASSLSSLPELRSQLLGAGDAKDKVVDHQQLQEEYLQGAYQSVLQLKTIAKDTHASVREGNEVIDDTLDAVSEADADMSKALAAMKQHLARGTNLYIYITMLFTLLLFILIVVFIQLSSKTAPKA